MAPGCNLRARPEIPGLSLPPSSWVTLGKEVNFQAPQSPKLPSRHPQNKRPQLTAGLLCTERALPGPSPASAPGSARPLSVSPAGAPTAKARRVPAWQPGPGLFLRLPPGTTSPEGAAGTRSSVLGRQMERCAPGRSGPAARPAGPGPATAAGPAGRQPGSTRGPTAARRLLLTVRRRVRGLLCMQTPGERHVSCQGGPAPGAGLGAGLGAGQSRASGLAARGLASRGLLGRFQSPLAPPKAAEAPSQRGLGAPAPSSSPTLLSCPVGVGP